MTRTVAWVWLAAITLATAAACSSDREASPPTTRLADPVDRRGASEAVEAIDQALMIPLAQAKNFHHKAKVYMTDGNLPAAADSVRQILSLHFPSGAAEADDVRNDARALLAKLLLSQNQPDEAMRAVDEGIAQSPRDSFFLANLYTVRGEIHEARAAALGDAKDAAAVERRAAIAAYDRSIQINEKLQKQLMEER